LGPENRAETREAWKEERMFKGVFTALVTPFDEREEIDEEALRTLVDAQIAGGVAGLVPVGTTGESPTVSHEENIRIIEIVAEQAAGRVPVIAGTGSNSTREAVEMTQQAKKVGADASLQVTPYYNKPNQEGLYRHFTQIAEEGGLPVVVYNIPGRTGRNVETDTLMRLAEHPDIVGVKEASGSIPQMMDVVAGRPEGFAVLSGDDNLAFPLTAIGGDGVISVASNVAPRHMADMIAAALKGELAAARAEHYRLLPLFKGVFLDTNPIPIKYALSLVMGGSAVYRLPLVALDEIKQGRMKEILHEVGLI
jgi:4-hydroxy-tetrahydrodipicolinate synthase